MDLTVESPEPELALVSKTESESLAYRGRYWKRLWVGVLKKETNMFQRYGLPGIVILA